MCERIGGALAIVAFVVRFTDKVLNLPSLEGSTRWGIHGTVAALECS
jgi:hypothetical protein